MFRPKAGKTANIERLSKLLDTYNDIAHQNPIELKHEISSMELWRFFIDGCLQTGRGLAQGSFFQQPALLTSTVKDYVETHEGMSFKDEEIWSDSPLLQFLKAHSWQLSPQECATLTLADLLALDRGWLPFEVNEPGYTKALVNAFQAIFNFSVDLDNELIKKLHGLATHKVKNTEYEDGEDGTPGTFRSAKTANFRFGNTIVSEAGIKQILKQSHSQLSFSLTLFDSEDHLSMGAIKINPDSIKAIRQYFVDLKYDKENGITSYGQPAIVKHCESYDMKMFLRQIKDESSLTYRLLSELADTQDEPALAKVLARQIAEKNIDYSFFLESAQPHKTRSSLEATMTQYQETYNLAISASNNPLEKLLAIIRYIQGCERLHAFVDCNTRTNMLLMNHLLMRNGFPPVILNNPNQIATSSDTEALELVLDGMENTLKLAQHKKLFNVDTREVVDFLGANERTRDRFEYFQGVIAIEESARAEQSVGVKKTKN